MCKSHAENKKGECFLSKETFYGTYLFKYAEECLFFFAGWAFCRRFRVFMNIATIFAVLFDFFYHLNLMTPLFDFI